MAGKLTANVVVRHPETGAPEFLPAGSELPDWAADQVGDHCLDVDEQSVTEPEPKPAGNPPPTHGKGSSRGAWAEYARSHKVEVTDAMSREDIVEACRAANIQVD